MTGQPGRDPRRRELPDRLERQVVAALHVEDARAPGPLSVAADRERPPWVHRVHVAEDQDAGPLGRRMRQAPGQAVAEVEAPGQPRELGAHGVELVRRKVHHRVDRRRVMRRTLDGHPAEKPLEHPLRVEGERGEIGNGMAGQLRVLERAGMPLYVVGPQAGQGICRASGARRQWHRASEWLTSLPAAAHCNRNDRIG